MSKNEVAQVKITETEKTKRKQIEENIWSYRWKIMIVVTAGTVIAIGFITGFGR